MRLHRRAARRRGGFTLIELLVVILIIALLVSLISSAVFQAFVKMDEVKTRHEITTLAGSVKQFESDFNITVPPPSRLYLDETGTYNPAVNYPGYGGLSAARQAALNQLAADSSAYLRKVWPRLSYTTVYPNGTGIDWNSNGQIDNTPVILEGQQCLVFFLGGAKSGQLFVGFSAVNSTNPMDISNPSTKRKGPYFQFDISRCMPAPGPGTFPVYLDTYGPAYAYFSSGTAQNKYDVYYTIDNTFGHDCNSLTNTAPYFNQPTAGGAYQYYNTDTFQIISAGRDKKFGPGGQWTSGDGSGMVAGGMDNITNFYDAKLGTTP